MTRDSHATPLARRAGELGLRVVLTDSIDTAVGRAAVIHVASALAPPIGGAMLEPTGPGLGVSLDSAFERELRWHA